MKKHSFWIMEPGLNVHVDNIVTERMKDWNTISFSQGEQIDAKEAAWYLCDFCTERKWDAIHVINRIILEHFQAFLPLRILRDGYYPIWGLPQTSYGIIPHDELPQMCDILMTLPPLASWNRLRELCMQAYGEGKHVIYQGIVDEAP